jgi:hypothetical protein
MIARAAEMNNFLWAIFLPFMIVPIVTNNPDSRIEEFGASLIPYKLTLANLRT